MRDRVRPARPGSTSVAPLGRFAAASAPPSSPAPSSLPAPLRRFLEPRVAPTPGEQCEFCTVSLADTASRADTSRADDHPHVVDLESRTLKCACRSCWYLFAPEGAGGGRYRAVPERYLHDPAWHLDERLWDELQVPVGMAFFFVHSGRGEPVAFYPSPAGATESLLPLAAWQEIVEANPVLGSLEPDVEALLVRRGNRAIACYLVPIDACYELVGLIRSRWKGFDGGAEATAAIDEFFGRLDGRSRSPTAAAPSAAGDARTAVPDV